MDFIAKNYVSLFKNNTPRALSNLQSTRVEESENSKVNYTYGSHESLFAYNKSSIDHSVLLFRFGSSDCSCLKIVYCRYMRRSKKTGSPSDSLYYFLISRPYTKVFSIRRCLDYFY